MDLVWRLALLWSCLGYVSLAGLAQSVSLESQPGTLTVPSSDFSAEARIVLKNPGPENFRSLRLLQFSNDGIKADIKKPSAPSAASKQSVVWPVTIRGAADAHFPASIIFDAEYADASGRHHSYATVSIQADSTAKLAEISLEGTLDTVSQQRPGMLYLTVTNNADVAAEISLRSPVPPPIEVVPALGAFNVLPHSSTSMRIDVRTASRVTPGTYPIVIETTAKWNFGGRSLVRNYVSTKTCTIGVFFESELLKILSVPSFLVLPGCLMVFTFQFLLSFNFLGLKDHSKFPDLGITSPGFWILAVSFSGIFAWTYYLITSVNYLVAYGADDLRNVWVISVPFGAVLYFVVALSSLNYRRDHVPSSSDGPVAILEKLANNDLGIRLPAVTYTLNNQALTGFLIEKIEDDQAKVWISPHMTATWPDTALARPLKAEFDGVLNSNRDPAKLAEILKRAGDSVTVEWDAEGVIPNPYHAKIEAITQYSPSDLIVG